MWVYWRENWISTNMLEIEDDIQRGIYFQWKMWLRWYFWLLLLLLTILHCSNHFQVSYWLAFWHHIQLLNYHRWHFLGVIRWRCIYCFYNFTVICKKITFFVSIASRIFNIFFYLLILFFVVLYLWICKSIVFFYWIFFS